MPHRGEQASSRNMDEKLHGEQLCLVLPDRLCEAESDTLRLVRGFGGPLASFCGLVVGPR